MPGSEPRDCVGVWLDARVSLMLAGFDLAILGFWMYVIEEVIYKF